MSRLTLPEHIQLRTAVPADDVFLYRLLEERYALGRANIQGMALEHLPSFEEHQAYLRSEPYDRLEIVSAHGEQAGMVYLAPGGILGAFVLAAWVGSGAGLAACYAICKDAPRPVVAHCNPTNRTAWRCAERLGFERTAATDERVTYVLNGPLRDPFEGLRKRS